MTRIVGEPGMSTDPMSLAYSLTRDSGATIVLTPGRWIERTTWRATWSSAPLPAKSRTVMPVAGDGAGFGAAATGFGTAATGLGAAATGFGAAAAGAGGPATGPSSVPPASAAARLRAAHARHAPTTPVALSPPPPRP